MLIIMEICAFCLGCMTLALPATRNTFTCELDIGIGGKFGDFWEKIFHWFKYDNSNEEHSRFLGCIVYPHCSSKWMGPNDRFYAPGDVNDIHPVYSLFAYTFETMVVVKLDVLSLEINDLM